MSLGNLVLKFDSSISPKALPKKEFAPISFHLSATSRPRTANTRPRPRPSRVTSTRIGLLNTRASPDCNAGALEARPTAQAEAACKDSLIGKGTASAEVEFAEQAPFTATGPLRVFNGGTKGNKTLVLVHVYANVPAPTAFITKVFVTKEHKGKFGYHIDSKIPVVAGGCRFADQLLDHEQKNLHLQGEEAELLQRQMPDGQPVWRR